MAGSKGSKTLVIILCIVLVIALLGGGFFLAKPYIEDKFGITLWGSSKSNDYYEDEDSSNFGVENEEKSNTEKEKVIEEVAVVDENESGETQEVVDNSKEKPVDNESTPIVVDEEKIEVGNAGESKGGNEVLIDKTNLLDDKLVNTMGINPFNLGTEMNIVSQGDWIYYVNNNKVYRLKKDLTEKTVILELDFYPHDMNIIGDYLYFRSDSGIYKFRKNTATINKITADDAYNMHVLDDTIYYINFSDSRKIYSIKTDGSSRTLVVDREKIDQLRMFDNKIYYVSSENKLFRCDLDGNNEEKVNTTTSNFISFVIYEDRVIENRPNTIYSTNLNNPNDVLEINKFVSSETEFKIYDNKYYYEHGGTLNKINMDGTEQQLIRDDLKIRFSYVYNKVHNYRHEGGIILIDDYFYYYDSGDEGRLYRIHPDGTGEERIS